MTPWQVNPYRLVSLNEMQQFYGHIFGHLAKLLGRLQEISSSISRTDRGPLEDDRRIQLQDFTSHLLECCQSNHLDLSGKAVIRVQRALGGEGCNHLSVVSMLDNVSHIIYDEMELTLFLHVDQAMASYYREPWEAFGLNILESLVPLADDFTSLSLNIEEAGKCLALSRNTAAVFHLMRVMEAGLRILANQARKTGLVITESNPTWDALLKPIDREILKSTDQKTVEWKKVEPVYAEMVSHLRSVKVAWRNPTMHVASSYDDERAMDIFRAVRGFMRHLATNLSG